MVDVPQSCSLHAPIELVEEAFRDSKTIEFHRYSEDGFDFVSKGLDKGAGVSTLMNILQLSKDEIMVFGDNYNDIPMFHVVSHRVVMGNGVDAAKDMATYITDDCAHDGIYNACVKLNLI